MIKAGVVGVGAMGKHHARIYSSMSGVELVGVADIDENRVRALAISYKTQPYSQYQDLLKQDLDVVSIAVPTSLHEIVAMEAIQQGCHILIEKPIAHMVASGKRIISAAKEQRVKLMVGQIERFNPVTSSMMDMVGGEDILLLELTRVGPFPPRIKDVGVVVDLGIHDIDLIRHISSSEVKSVKSVVSGSVPGKEDSAILVFELEDGTIARVTTNWLTPFKIRKITIATRTKFIEGDLVAQRVTEYRAGDEDGTYVVKEIGVPYAEPLMLELEAFINSVKNNTIPPVTGEDGLKALAIAADALRAMSPATS